jgi:hypothetical protein
MQNRGEIIARKPLLAYCLNAKTLSKTPRVTKKEPKKSQKRTEKEQS